MEGVERTGDRSAERSELRFVVGRDVRDGASWEARSGRRRVLVEAPEDQWDFVTRWARSRLAGYDVVVCGGPEATHDCPVLSGEPCPVAEDADAVVAGLGLDPPPGSEGQSGLRSRVSPVPRSPGTPPA